MLEFNASGAHLGVDLGVTLVLMLFLMMILIRCSGPPTLPMRPFLARQCSILIFTTVLPFLNLSLISVNQVVGVSMDTTNSIFDWLDSNPDLKEFNVPLMSDR